MLTSLTRGRVHACTQRRRTCSRETACTELGAGRRPEKNAVWWRCHLSIRAAAGIPNSTTGGPGSVTGTGTGAGTGTAVDPRPPAGLPALRPPQRRRQLQHCQRSPPVLGLLPVLCPHHLQCQCLCLILQSLDRYQCLILQRLYRCRCLILQRLYRCQCLTLQRLYRCRCLFAQHLYQYQCQCLYSVSVAVILHLVSVFSMYRCQCLILQRPYQSQCLISQHLYRYQCQCLYSVSVVPASADTSAGSLSWTVSGKSQCHQRQSPEHTQG